MNEPDRTFSEESNLIAGMVNQHCYANERGEVSAGGLSIDAEAIDYLVRNGRMRYIGKAAGRVSLAAWVNDP